MTWITIAHVIRHQSTGQFRAVSTISSRNRWCLTGTPIQNSLKDLGALVKFLRVPLLETSQEFLNHIISPIESGSSHGVSSLRLLLKSLCLRRTNELLRLSEPAVHLYRLDLTRVEDAAYAHVGEMYRQEVDRAVSGKKVAEGYSGILQALLRLRLLCNHGTYEHGSLESGAAPPSEPEEDLEFLRQNDNASCEYCSCDIAVTGKLNDLRSAEFTACPHLLCSECLPQYEADVRETRVGNKAQCPLCENLIVNNFIVSEEKRVRKLSVHLPVSPIPLATFRTDCNYSTKLATLVQDIETQGEADKR